MPVDSVTAQEQWDRYVYVRDNGHLDFLTKARRCDDYFQGLQWEESVRKALKCKGQPAMTINVTLATINAIMGEQLQNRADVSFKPAKGGTDAIASELAKVWLHVANSNGVHDLESDMFDDGVITSRGFLDMRISFDDHMQGEIDIRHVTSRNVGIDPDAETYDPDEWKDVFHTKWLTGEEVKKDYPGLSKQDILGLTTSRHGYDSLDIDEKVGGFGGFDDRIADIPMDRKRIRVLERQFWEIERQPHFVDINTGDMRVVPESWDRERIQFAMNRYNLAVIDRDAPRITWRVTAGDLVLFDSKSPYKHFTIVPYFPFFRKGITMGMAEQFIDLNDILNKTSSQELHIVNSSANGGWKYKSGSLKNMDIEEFEKRAAETGLVLELEDVNDAERITPNQVPTGIDRITFKTREWIKDISGVSDTSRGFDREDVAAKAIQAKQIAGSVNLAKPFENLARTRKILIRNALDLIQSYYTERRVLQITGDTPGAASETLVINDTDPISGDIINDLTVGEYSVVVTTVPLRETWQETQFQQALQLRTEAGIPIPDQYLIKNSNLADKDEILQSMTDAGAQEMQARMQEAEIRRKELENLELEVEIERKRQEAGLAGARASKTNADTVKIIQGEDSANPQQDGAMPLLEVAKADQEADIEQQKLDLERRIEFEKLKLDRDIAEQKLALEKDIAEQNQLLKIAEAEDKAEMAMMQARAKIKQAEMIAKKLQQKAKTSEEGK